MQYLIITNRSWLSETQELFAIMCAKTPRYKLVAFTSIMVRLGLEFNF